MIMHRTCKSSRADKIRRARPARQVWRKRPGLTLVEILIVITILALLFALGTFGISQAVNKARNTQLTLDLNQLETSFNTYKADHTAYPPTLFPVNGNYTCGTPDPAEPYMRRRFNSHMRQLYPRYSAVVTIGGAQYRDPYDHFGLRAKDRYGLDIYDLDPGEMIVLWLGGISDSGGGTSAGNDSGGTKLVGFGGSPTDPLGVHLTTGASLGPINQPKQQKHELPANRLVDRDGDGWYEFTNDVSTDVGPMPPYVYFDFTAYAADYDNDGVFDEIASYDKGNTIYGTAVPYASKLAAGAVQAWVNPQTFQIITPGLDGQYGDMIAVGSAPGAKLFPDGVGYSRTDDDNVCNFATSTLRVAQETKQ